MQRIAASKWPSRQAAKAGACIGGSAVQTERHFEAAFDGKIRAERVATQAHAYDFAFRQAHSLTRLDEGAVASVDFQAASTSDQRDAHIRGEDLECWSGTDDLKTG